MSYAIELVRAYQELEAAKQAARATGTKERDMQMKVKCVTGMFGSSVVRLEDGRYVGVAGELPFREGESGVLCLPSFISFRTEQEARENLCAALAGLQQAGVPLVATRPD